MFRVLDLMVISTEEIGKNAVKSMHLFGRRGPQCFFHRNLTPDSSRPHPAHCTIELDKLMSQPQQTVEFRPKGSIDASSALLPYSGPWNPHLAAHLLRRAGFGGSPADIQSAVDAGMEATVDRLVHPQTDSLPSGPAGDLSYGPMVDPIQRRNAFYLTVSWWLDRMLQSPNPLVERMVYFWHNHFTSAIDGGITPSLIVAQNNLFRTHALGNFADLTHRIAQDPAMLLYLNGNQNRKQHPNENFARELMELFTMGVGNYSEQDVRESARAFTGWVLPRDATVATFVPRLHDDGAKTILGRTGNFAGDDVIDIIMQQPATGKFMARKVLRHFVYDDPEPELIDVAAARLRDSRYDIGSLMGTLLRSNVFYSPRAYRSLVKSPVELVVGALRTIGVTSSTPRVTGAMGQMNQVLFHPPNVAGWPGGSQWLNQGTILARLNFLNQLVSFHRDAKAAAATPPANPMQAMPVMTGPQSWISGAAIKDPGSVTEHVLALAVQDDATEEQRRSIMLYLQSDSVGNPVDLNGENIDEKVRGAMSLALALPAYQLA
jgi:hypothetical protein